MNGDFEEGETTGIPYWTTVPALNSGGGVYYDPSNIPPMVFFLNGANSKTCSIKQSFNFSVDINTINCAYAAGEYLRYGACGAL